MGENRDHLTCIVEDVLATSTSCGTHGKESEPHHPDYDMVVLRLRYLLLTELNLPPECLDAKDICNSVFVQLAKNKIGKSVLDYLDPSYSLFCEMANPRNENEFNIMARHCTLEKTRGWRMRDGPDLIEFQFRMDKLMAIEREFALPEYPIIHVAQILYLLDYFPYTFVEHVQHIFRVTGWKHTLNSAAGPVERSDVLKFLAVIWEMAPGDFPETTRFTEIVNTGLRKISWFSGGGYEGSSSRIGILSTFLTERKGVAKKYQKARRKTYKALWKCYEKGLDFRDAMKEHCGIEFQ